MIEGAEHGFPGVLQVGFSHMLGIDENREARGTHVLSEPRQKLLAAVNRFLEETGLDTIEYQGTEPVEEFDEKVRDLFWNISYHNPGETSLRLVSDSGYCQVLSELFQSASKYLHEVKYPIKIAGGSDAPTGLENPDNAVPCLYGQVGVEIAEIDVTKPILISFGGAYVFQGNNLLVHGMTKLAAELSGEAKSQANTTQHAVLPYPCTYPSYIYTHGFNYNMEPDSYHSPYAGRFVAEYLMPFISRTEEPQKYERLEKEEMLERMGNLRFFGYSYGGAFVQEVCNALKKEMKELHYEPEEIQEGLAQVFALTVGAACRLVGKPEGNFTQCHLISRSDDYAKVFSNTLMHHPEIAQSAATEVLKIDERQLILAGDTGRQGVIWRTSRQDGEPYLVPQIRPDPKGHDIRNYLSSGPRQHGIYYPQAAINALRNALEMSHKHEPISSIEELMRKTPQTGRSFAELVLREGTSIPRSY